MAFSCLMGTITQVPPSTRRFWFCQPGTLTRARRRAGRSSRRWGRRRGGGRGGRSLPRLPRWSGATVVVEVGGGVAGVGGVDLDPGVAQFVRELDRHHVQRGLRGVVAEDLDLGVGRGRVGVEGEGAEAAGDVDDAARGALADEGEHRLGHGDGGEEVGVEVAPDGVEVGLARRPVALGRDARVVDQHVEVAVLALDLRGGGLDRLGGAEVERDLAHVEPLSSQLRGGLRAPRRVARAEQHRHPCLAKLSRDLEADALVRARDESNPLLRLIHGCSTRILGRHPFTWPSRGEVNPGCLSFS